MKKRNVFILAAILILTLLAGCGAQGGNASADSDVSGSASKLDTNYYDVCTNYSKAEVEAFASQVKQQILSSDWSGLSENIAYPITIDGVVYPDSGTFINAPFDKLFSKSFLDAISAESCEDMFCNADGIMMGNGEVWIAETLDDDLKSQGLQIISINVPDQKQNPTFKPGV
ncbi:MAG: hypothetical protein LKK00_04765 [Intestinimonas sp.]|jgi:outer membrane murein-binding lipoprotein Lpp|nr:hypothetical protein [Intestinimonas sp.]